jgi:acetyl-CoA hydrolase
MRIIDPATADLAEFVRPGDTVAWGQGAAEPLALTRALAAQRRALGRIRVFMGIGASDTFAPEHADHIDFLSYCGSGSNRRLARAGVLDALPCHYSSLPELIAGNRLKIDVVMVQLAPADGAGRYSLGVARDYLPAAISRARVVLAEINDQAPWTHGGETLSCDDIDAAVHVSRPLLELGPRNIGATELAIGRYVAELVEDGATLQIGIGNIPDAVLAALAGRRDLGVHSGLIGDGVADLMSAGVITNARKNMDRGLTVTGLAMGGDRLYRLLDRNPAVAFRSIEYTHDPAVLAGLDRFVAINSALEVDLTGQINAEVVDGIYVGAVGGAADFLRAAARSRGGVPIVALPACAGGRSRVVARLSGPVTTARADAGVIVTEHGVADLRGASVSERVHRMLAIADPVHREALARQARDRP